MRAQAERFTPRRIFSTLQSASLDKLREERMRGWFGIFLALFTCLVCSNSISSTAPVVQADLRMIQALLDQPEESIDLATTVLTIEKMIDPTIDIDDAIRRLNSMASAVKASAGPNAKSSDLAQVLRSYLYDAGTWNFQQPFRYDLDDPLGEKVSNKLLATYLKTRKGNCISMPMLYVVLAQKLGIDATFAHSPRHYFVRYRDETGNSYNLETTSGGYPRRDLLYQNDRPMTPLALKNGLYMRALGKRESIAVVTLGVLMEKHVREKRFDKVIELADFSLERFPRDTEAMTTKGYAYFGLAEREFIDRYPTVRDIPIKELARYQYLQRTSKFWYDKAESLGWRDSTNEEEERYMKGVREARSIQAGRN